MTELSRRAVLAAGVTAGVSGLAGCLDSVVEDEENSGGTSGDDESDGEGTPAGEELNEGADSPEVVDVSTETTDTGCRSDSEEGAATEIQGDSATITGTMHAPSPCYAATADASVDGTTLEVRLGATKDDDECVQCLGAVQHRTAVQLSSAGVEEIDVMYEDKAGASTEADVSRESVDGLSVETAETTDTRCESGEERVTASREGDTLSLTGVIQASDPCHEAVVDSLTTTDGVPTVTIDVESTLDEGEMCQQCIGHVSYEVTLVTTAEMADSELKVEHTTGFSDTV
jgi:hypothetical protein